uniref:Salicylate hydroxylase n=1 Tax=Kwoniella dejecticola CBS 10117 TaxID=1296121 RepID=A0A1A5ZTF0_9TREE|nr:salicylate hydroxylase [Kwoniella dejecticola CBS 10117]OBR81040.1 salicylate hydroxylase [Kwoniella dejecticola CBS 10117]
MLKLNFNLRMGGMGCALALAKAGFKQINVWEAAPALGEVGAGINIPPNLARILDGWGVLPIVRSEGVDLTKANVLDCSTDEILSTVRYEDYMEKDYGYPFMVGHRLLARSLYSLVQGAEATGVVKLHLGQYITEYDFDETRFQVKDKDSQSTQWVEADVILAADGIKSRARAVMLMRKGEIDEVTDTAQAAYRIMVRRSAIKEDPELLPFFTGTQSYRWIGEKRHIIAYPIESGDLFNMSTTQPDRNFVQADTWTASGSKAEMLATFHDFCPRVQKLLNLVPEGDVLEWKLRIHEPLPEWIDNRSALVGDACHPTLPHIAQGAAQAIEDAAALGVLLSKLQTKDDIVKCLRVYQDLRKPRTDWAVLTASANSRGLHSRDKSSRDAEFKAVAKDGMTNPDKMLSRDVHEILFRYDVVAEAEKNYQALFAEY